MYLNTDSNVSEDLLPYLQGRRVFCPEDGRAGSSDDLVCIYQTTCSHLPEDCKHNIHYSDLRSKVLIHIFQDCLSG
jgi:hypothetical protein